MEKVTIDKAVNWFELSKKFSQKTIIGFYKNNFILR